jgi:hypothetical protein
MNIMTIIYEAPFKCIIEVTEWALKQGIQPRFGMDSVQATLIIASITQRVRITSSTLIALIAVRSASRCVR